MGSEMCIRDRLSAEEHLNFNTRQLLEVMYFYSNFPLDLRNTTSLLDSLYNKQNVRKSLSEYDKYKMFYNAVVLSYNNTKRDMPFLEYFVSIVHMFNMFDKTIELDDTIFEYLVQNLYFHLDVPLEQTLDINIGRKNYDLKISQYRTLERLSADAYMTVSYTHLTLPTNREV